MFYKQEVIRPLLFGKSKEENRLEKMERTMTELQQSIVTTLATVQESLTVLQGMVSKQDEKLQAISHDVYNKQVSIAFFQIDDSVNLNFKDESSFCITVYLHCIVVLRVVSKTPRGAGNSPALSDLIIIPGYFCISNIIQLNFFGSSFDLLQFLPRDNTE